MKCSAPSGALRAIFAVSWLEARWDHCSEWTYDVTAKNIVASSA
ncbi:MAG: hypothetical protein ACE5FL_03030 [Myxococcota bacterium]